jgi:hypothetical protein
MVDERGAETEEDHRGLLALLNVDEWADQSEAGCW